MKLIIYIFLLYLAPNLLWGQDQIIFNQSFTDLLRQYPLHFDQPEDWFKLQPLQEDEFLNYALVIQSLDPAIEIRFRFTPYEANSNTFPDFEFTRLLTNISSNEATHMFFLKNIERVALQDTYHADWGAIGTFKPKESFSDKERAKLVSIFKEDVGSIQIILLYNGSSTQVRPYLSLLTFQNNISG